jgi:hypothetical protein
MAVVMVMEMLLISSPGADLLNYRLSYEIL